MRLLNFGSLNIDYVYRVDSFVRPGETKTARSLSIFPGGKGLNQSLALAKAGIEVWHAGKTGADGDFLLAELKRGGVNVSRVGRSAEPTGHAIIQVDDSGGNCIILYGGANRDIDPDYVDQALSGFGRGDMLVLQNEISSIPKILSAASERGMRIAMNPAPFHAEVLDYPLELLDFLILNEIEAEGLSGEGSPERAIQSLRARYPRAGVVITLGEQGALYADTSGLLSHPAYRVRAVDTTAAGDTFSGYFLAVINEGGSAAEALELASRAAAICVTRPGAAVSVPSRKEVDAFLSQAE